MASRQTNAAGSFTDGSKFVGGVAPVSGDTLTCNHAMTWAPAAGSSFTLGTGTGTAVTFGSAGSLTITPLGAFTLTFAGKTAGGNITTYEFVVNAVNGNVTINLDATSDTAGFAMVTGGTYDVNNRGGWNLLATDPYKIEVVSLPGDNSKNGYFVDGSNGGGGVVNGQNFTLRRIGVANTTAAYAPKLDNRVRTLSWTGVTLDGCGEVTLSGDASYTGTITFTDVVSVNTATNASTKYPLNLGFAASGTRTFSGCVWDKSVKHGAPRGVTYNNGTYFHNGWAGTETTVVWGGVDGCFVRQTFDSMITPGTVKNSFLYWDSSSGVNPHFVQGPIAPSGTVTIDWSNNVAYFNGTDANGNVFLPATSTSATLSYTINNNLILANRGGSATGVLVTCNGNVTAGLSITANHNTVFCKDQHGFEVGHGVTVVESPLRWAAIKSNLFIGGGTGYKVFNPDNTTYTDLIAPANSDYNGSHQIKATSGNPNYANEGKGYATKQSVTAGAHDVDGQDPSFVDPTASLATWAASIGSTGATTLDREADALLYVKADRTRVAALMAYLAAAYRPTNSAFRNAAHDGTDIGAFAWISGSIPPVHCRPALGGTLFSRVF